MDPETELAETRALLHEAIALLKHGVEMHNQDVSQLRGIFNIQEKDHQDAMAGIHRLLRESEERMVSTNQMVQKLSQSCSDLVRINGELKDSYLRQFEEATSMNRKLIEEAEYMRRENEAYLEEIKDLRVQVSEERARYDRMMEQMVSLVCSGGRSSSPLVAIDSKS